MLLVKTRLGLSTIHGIGLLADEFIAAGTVVWEHNDFIDRIYRFDKLVPIPEPAQTFLKTYGWREGSYFIMPCDNARFVNHSDEPNCKVLDNGTSVASKDIYPGEEITESYEAFDDDFMLYAPDFTGQEDGN